MAEDQPTAQLIYPPESTFLQFVGGQHWPMQSIKKNTHHSLRSIVVASGNFSSESKQREAVPRNKKQSWSTVDFKESI